MSAAELRAVAERTRALDILRRDAAERRCRVSVVDEDGAHVGTVAGPSRADGTCAEPVEMFDRVVGWVVTAPGENGAGADAAPDVARRGAALLSDLCSREYELNDLSREILGAYEELNVFYELSADLAAARDAGAIARIVAERASKVLGASSAWMLLADRDAGALRLAAAAGPCDVPAAGVAVEGRAAACLASGTPDLLDSAAAAADGPPAAWERGAGGPLLTVPVSLSDRADRTPLGVLQVRRAVGAETFSSGDIKLAWALASHAAVLVENQRLIAYERELQLARTIQQGLLPGAPPRLPGLDVAGRCLVASNVGGDYYDHFAAGEGRIGLVVADVSGHDLAAALLQSAARATVRAQAAGGDRGPADVLAGTNRALFDDLSRAEMFLTAWVGVADAATGVVRFADAGHPPALVLRAADGRVEEVGAGGPPIGVLSDARFAEGATVLAPGDVLLAYTDGLTEARRRDSGEEFGEARLADALRAAAGGPADAIADALLAAAGAWAGDGAGADDRSLVVIKMRGGDSR